jgi:hypothetical protein
MSAVALISNEEHDSEILQYGAITGDTTAPVVSNVTPAAGSTLAPGASVQFDVTDDGSFRKLLVTVAHGGLNEVVYEDSTFRGGYSERSTATVISGGYRFVIYRFDGWKGPPTVRVHAVDTGGNEST